MAAPPPRHVAELLARGAVTDEAKKGLDRLRALPALDAWWRAIDVLSRVVLPETLEAVQSSFTNELLRRHAEPLIEIAARLRALPPLPDSAAELVPLLRQAGPLTLSRFLASLEICLLRPGEAHPSGPLHMALFRWPGLSSRGHYLNAVGGPEAMIATLEAIARA